MKTNYTFQFENDHEAELFDKWIRTFPVLITDQRFFQNTDHLKQNKEYKKLIKDKKLLTARIDDYIIANKIK